MENSPAPLHPSSTTRLLGEGVSTDHLPQVCGNLWRETPGRPTAVPEAAPDHIGGSAPTLSAPGRAHHAEGDKRSIYWYER